MSPEGFIHNIYGPKTDVWAFGVLVYELLHGETPFSSCRTEQELKQSLSFPIPKSKIRHEISSDIKEVILKCMEIDEGKRVTIAELANLSYFKRIMRKEPLYGNLQPAPGIHGSAYDLRMRSPSYNGNEAGSNKYLKSEQIPKRIEKTNSNQYTAPFSLQNNIPPSSSEKIASPTYNPQLPSNNNLNIPK